MQWGSEIHSDIRQFYAAVAPKLLAQQADRLESAVLTVSQDVNFVVRCSSDPDDVLRAIDGLRREESGREVTFEAIRQALQEYLPVRVEQRREVLFVIVTDEAGDDWQAVDQLIGPPRKYALPVYVIGVPAPLAGPRHWMPMSSRVSRVAVPAASCVNRWRWERGNRFCRAPNHGRWNEFI